MIRPHHLVIIVQAIVRLIHNIGGPSLGQRPIVRWLTTDVQCKGGRAVLCALYEKHHHANVRFLQEHTRTSTRVDVTRHVAGTYDENTNIMKTYTSHATTTNANPTNKDPPPPVHLAMFYSFVGQEVRFLGKKCQTKSV